MRQALATKARKHWETWLPAKTADLKAAGQFEEAVQGAAALAQQQISQLMQQGYQQHEAEEVVLRELILLAPEAGAEESDEERAELAELEAAYQKAPPPHL